MNFFKKNAIAIAIIAVGIAFIAFGAMRGEPQTVYRKASNICMECIGIG